MFQISLLVFSLTAINFSKQTLNTFLVGKSNHINSFGHWKNVVFHCIHWKPIIWQFVCH